MSASLALNISRRSWDSARRPLNEFECQKSRRGASITRMILDFIKDWYVPVASLFGGGWLWAIVLFLASLQKKAEIARRTTKQHELLLNDSVTLS